MLFFFLSCRITLIQRDNFFYFVFFLTRLLFYCAGGLARALESWGHGNHWQYNVCHTLYSERGWQWHTAAVEESHYQATRPGRLIKKEIKNERPRWQFSFHWRFASLPDKDHIVRNLFVVIYFLLFYWTHFVLFFLFLQCMFLYCCNLCSRSVYFMASCIVVYLLYWFYLPFFISSIYAFVLFLCIFYNLNYI